MRIFISGPMTGLPDLNYPAFNEKWRELNILYPTATVVNPAVTGEAYAEELRAAGIDVTYADYMSDAIDQLNTCDTIYFLPGWTKSDGACAEYYFAKHEKKLMVFDKLAIAKRP